MRFSFELKVLSGSKDYGEVKISPLLPNFTLVMTINDGHAEALFTPGATTTEIVSWINEKLATKDEVGWTDIKD